MHKLFFDCETGGLNPEVHSLLTCYFGIYDDEYKLIDDLELQLKPSDINKLNLEAEAMEVTGIDIQKHLADPATITYEEAAEKFMVFLAKNKIPNKRKSFRPCGHNVEFDINFITKQLLSTEGWEKVIHHAPIDTFRILTFLQDIGTMPTSLGKLHSLVEYFNIPPKEYHNAKADVQMTVEIYRRFKDLFLARKKSLISGNQIDLLKVIED